jgi:DNA-binding NarL/FixJ family response regulator
VPLRVAIVASSAAARRGLEAVVRDAGLEVAGGGGLADVVSAAAEVVLAELQPGEERRLTLPRHGPIWVVLMDEPDPNWLAGALQGSVRGVLPHAATDAEIAAALAAAAVGLVCLDPSWVARLTPYREQTEEVTLTAREREVLLQLAEGLGNKEIAARLGISEHTVKFHLSSLFGKLDATSRAEAVSAGMRRGLVWL